MSRGEGRVFEVHMPSGAWRMLVSKIALIASALDNFISSVPRHSSLVTRSSRTKRSSGRPAAERRIAKSAF